MLKAIELVEYLDNEKHIGATTLTGKNIICSMPVKVATVSYIKKLSSIAEQMPALVHDKDNVMLVFNRK